MKGHEKLDQKMVPFLVYHFVGGHLDLLKDVNKKFCKRRFPKVPQNP